VLSAVLQVRLAAMFGIKASLFNFGPDASVISFQHRSHSAREVGCCPSVICSGFVHEIEQAPALGAKV
jgi:hypothetical protein